MKALVVDDEPLARRKLRDLIGEVDWLEHVGEAADGDSAVALAAKLRADVVFLDIQMPGLSGIEVAGQLIALPKPPVVVFTTAHDRHAVAAFELGAVDYLLKPFGKERFRKALERVRKSAGSQQNRAALERATDVVARAQAGLPLDRIFVRERQAIVPVKLADISHVEAQDDYVMLHANGRRHLVSLGIAELERRLPQPPFLRVHRSHIVNLDHVERIVQAESARLEVRLMTGAIIPVSRARSQAVRDLVR
jgi:two-component system LytT family response regulator